MATEQKTDPADAREPGPSALDNRYFTIPASSDDVRAQMERAQQEGRDYEAKVLETVLTSRIIATPGKGILAADESMGTIQKRFNGMGPVKTNQPLAENETASEEPQILKADRPYLENQALAHQIYRELLFTAPGLQESISGVIMFMDTLTDGQAYAGGEVDVEGGKTTIEAGTSFAALLQKRGIVTGIKVDAGAKSELPQVPGAPFTAGLDSLPGKCKRAYDLGARFAKWRATLKIRNGFIPQAAITETAWTLARYASVCQVNGLAPIVEPELLMDGNHSLATCQYWTEKILSACYKALVDQEVILEGTLLKPNMVLPGQLSPEHLRVVDGGDPPTPAELDARDLSFALATVSALRRTVPAAVPGIVFLSGGQTEAQATRRLNFINQQPGLAWNCSFSYGRALQQSCLQTWLGQEDNVAAAQEQLRLRGEANSRAQLGQLDDCSDEMKAKYETVAAHLDSFIGNYSY